MVNGQAGVTVHRHVEMPHRLALKSVWIHRGKIVHNLHVKRKNLKREHNTDHATTQWPVQVC